MIKLNERFCCYVEYSTSLECVKVTIRIYKDREYWLDRVEYVRKPNVIEKILKMSYKQKIKRAEERFIEEARRLADKKLRVMIEVESL